MPHNRYARHVPLLFTLDTGRFNVAFAAQSESNSLMPSRSITMSQSKHTRYCNFYRTCLYHHSAKSMRKIHTLSSSREELIKTGLFLSYLSPRI